MRAILLAIHSGGKAEIERECCANRLLVVWLLRHCVPHFLDHLNQGHERIRRWSDWVWTTVGADIQEWNVKGKKLQQIMDRKVDGYMPSLYFFFVWSLLTLVPQIGSSIVSDLIYAPDCNPFFLRYQFLFSSTLALSCTITVAGREGNVKKTMAECDMRHGWIRFPIDASATKKNGRTKRIKYVHHVVQNVKDESFLLLCNGVSPGEKMQSSWDVTSYYS